MGNKIIDKCNSMLYNPNPSFKNNAPTKMKDLANLNVNPKHSGSGGSTPAYTQTAHL